MPDSVSFDWKGPIPWTRPCFRDRGRFQCLYTPVPYSAISLVSVKRDWWFLDLSLVHFSQWGPSVLPDNSDCNFRIKIMFTNKQTNKQTTWWHMHTTVLYHYLSFGANTPLVLQPHTKPVPKPPHKIQRFYTITWWSSYRTSLVLQPCVTIVCSL